MRLHELEKRALEFCEKLQYQLKKQYTSRKFILRITRIKNAFVVVIREKLQQKMLFWHRTEKIALLEYWSAGQYGMLTFKGEFGNHNELERLVHSLKKNLNIGVRYAHRVNPTYGKGFRM